MVFGILASLLREKIWCQELPGANILYYFPPISEDIKKVETVPSQIYARFASRITRVLLGATVAVENIISLLKTCQLQVEVLAALVVDNTSMAYWRSVDDLKRLFLLFWWFEVEY